MNKPSNHYGPGDGSRIEPIDLIKSLGILTPFCQGNIIKYVSRYKDKGGIEDLEKARIYLEWLIEREKEQEQAEKEALDNYIGIRVTDTGVYPDDLVVNAEKLPSGTERFAASIPRSAQPSNVVQLSEVIQQEGDATFFDPNETMYPGEEFDFAPLSKPKNSWAKKRLKDMGCPLPETRPQLVADQESEE